MESAITADEFFRHLIGPANLQLSPEEYAARHAHEWGCLGIDRYEISDLALKAWLCRFAEVFGDAQELELCRVRFLTPQERLKIEEEEKAGL